MDHVRSKNLGCVHLERRDTHNRAAEGIREPRAVRRTGRAVHCHIATILHRGTRRSSSVKGDLFCEVTGLYINEDIGKVREMYNAISIDLRRNCRVADGVKPVTGIILGRMEVFYGRPPETPSRSMPPTPVSRIQGRPLPSRSESRGRTWVVNPLGVSFTSFTFANLEHSDPGLGSFLLHQE